MKTVFETERLRARPIEVSDAPRVAELFQEKELPWNLGRAPWPYALSDAENWLTLAQKQWAAGTEFPFAILKDGTLIGSCGIMCIDEAQNIWEIGYWVGKPYWGKGYVTEASIGLLDWAEREAGITRFVSGHIFDNPASGHVLEKLGFELAGEIEMYVKGRDCNVRSPRYIRNAPVEVALKDPLTGKRR